MPPDEPRHPFFASLAERWDDLVDEGAMGEVLARILAPWEVALADAVVLDAGCGTGHLAAWLARRPRPPALVLALDYARPMLTRARQRLPVAPLLQSRCEALPLAPESIDLVLAHGLYPHLDRPELLLGEARRVLTPGGWILFLHTASRDFINQVHGETGGAVAGDLLPPVAEARAHLVASGWRPGPSGEDGTSWLVSGRK